MIFVLEGMDGCGKSTVAKEIQWKYSPNAKYWHFPNDPGVMELGQMPNVPGPVKVAAYLEDMLQVVETIKNEYSQNYVHIFDRFFMSTLVYQGLKYREMPMLSAGFAALEEFLAGTQSKVIILDVPVEVAKHRISSRGNFKNSFDLYENVSTRAWEERRRKYQDLAKENSGYVLVPAEGKTPVEIIQYAGVME